MVTNRFIHFMFYIRHCVFSGVFSLIKAIAYAIWHFFQLVGLGMKGSSFLKSRKHIWKFDCNTKRLYPYCIVWTFSSGLRNPNSNRLISNTYRFETLGLLIYLKTVFWQGVDVGSTNKTKLIADGVWVRPRRSMSELVSKSSRVTLPVLFLTQMAIWFINILI